MRRAVALLLLALAACAPGLTPGRPGFTAARAPAYGSVTIAPHNFGDGLNAAASFWNAAAGRHLFVATTASPQITFKAWGPQIIPDGPRAGQRVIAHVSAVRNPDGSMRSCAVNYDPSWVAQGVPLRTLNRRLIAHEIGHCLDLLGDHGNCASPGAMSNCDFWRRVLANEGPGPHDTAQLRAAGYIR